MKTFRALVDTVGAPILSEWLGVSRKHIGIMKIRNSSPPVYWPRIVAKIPKSANVSLGDLARMYEDQRKARSSGSGAAQ
jgi:hypothetical protein